MKVAGETWQRSRRALIYNPDNFVHNIKQEPVHAVHSFKIPKIDIFPFLVYSREFILGDHVIDSHYKFHKAPILLNKEKFYSDHDCGLFSSIKDHTRHKQFKRNISYRKLLGTTNLPLHLISTAAKSTKIHEENKNIRTIDSDSTIHKWFTGIRK